MTYTMLNYIERQPEILKKAVDNRDDYLSVILELFGKYKIKRMYFLGSGTSYHVSKLAAMWFGKYLNVEASASYPVVFTDTEEINKNGVYKPSEILVVGISQSGTSTSTINGIHKAIEKGCITLCFSQDKNSELATLCDYTMIIPCEKEMVPPETQGYTAAILAMYLCAITVAKAQGLLVNYDSKFLAVENMVNELLAKAICRGKKWIEDNHDELMEANKVYVTGANINYVTAMEGALKMGETMRKVVQTYESEEFAHVVDLACVKEDYLFAIVHSAFNKDRCLQISDVMKKISSHVFIISDVTNTSKQDCFFDFEIDEDLSVFYFVVPFQLIGAIIAEDLGIDTSRYPYDDIHSIAHNDDYHLYDL